jgi:hypothetical protein
MREESLLYQIKKFKFPFEQKHEKKDFVAITGHLKTYTRTNGACSVKGLCSNPTGKRSTAMPVQIECYLHITNL